MTLPAAIIDAPSLVDPMNEAGSWRRPLDWVLNASSSAFVPLIRERIRDGDTPANPTEVFARGGALFAKVEFGGPGPRWLVLALDRFPPTIRR